MKNSKKCNEREINYNRELQFHDVDDDESENSKEIQGLTFESQK